MTDWFFMLLLAATWLLHETATKRQKEPLGAFGGTPLCLQISSFSGTLGVNP